MKRKKRKIFELSFYDSLVIYKRETCRIKDINSTLYLENRLKFVLAFPGLLGPSLELFELCCDIKVLDKSVQFVLYCISYGDFLLI